MKKACLTIITIFIFAMAFSQQYDTTPPYLKDKLLPAFQLLNLDSADVTEKMLKPGLHTIIMLYNPECGHCQNQMELFISMPEVIKQTQIVLVSTLPIYKIKEFCKKYQLEKYPNIYPCKDNSWFFGKFYQPKTIPVLAFYNPQKQFTFISQGNASKQQILDALKK